MSEELFENPISPSVQDLITLFKKDLAAVVFPDVSLETLESLTEKVKSSAKELQDALSRAESARESLEAGQNELLAKAVRGLAYAKVFAEGNDDLLEKICKINLGKAARSPKKNVSEKPKSEKSQEETAQEAIEKSDDKKSAKASKKAAEQA
jgi:hypothetical protein